MDRIYFSSWWCNHCSIASHNLPKWGTNEIKSEVLKKLPLLIVSLILLPNGSFFTSQKISIMMFCQFVSKSCSFFSGLFFKGNAMEFNVSQSKIAEHSPRCIFSFYVWIAAAWIKCFRDLIINIDKLHKKWKRFVENCARLSMFTRL